MESVVLDIDERIAVLDGHIARLKLELYRQAMMRTRPVDMVPCERQLPDRLSYAAQSAAILNATTAEQRAAVLTAVLNDIARLKTTH